MEQAPEKTAEAEVTKLELEREGEVIETISSIEPMAAAGEETTTAVQDVRDEEEAEGAEPYFPPTDPVLNDRGREVLGGFEGSSIDKVEVEPSTIDEEPGDEALAEAVRRELREDALTSHLHLAVEVKRGVAFIRGATFDTEDTDNAAGVASRVPGVQRVVADIETPEI